MSDAHLPSDSLSIDTGRLALNVGIHRPDAGDGFAQLAQQGDSMNEQLPKEKKVDMAKAHDFVIVNNHRQDPTYAPYCGRCPGLHRMKVIEPFLWKHSCGAIHDERQVLS